MLARVEEQRQDGEIASGAQPGHVLRQREVDCRLDVSGVGEMI